MFTQEPKMKPTIKPLQLPIKVDHSDHTKSVSVDVNQFDIGMEYIVHEKIQGTNRQQPEDNNDDDSCDNSFLSCPDEN